jgi:hypothetical protein
LGSQVRMESTYRKKKPLRLESQRGLYLNKAIGFSGPHGPGRMSAADPKQNGCRPKEKYHESFSSIN